jgi:hypothetical protein
MKKSDSPAVFQKIKNCENREVEEYGICSTMPNLFTFGVRHREAVADLNRAVLINRAQE